MRHRKQCACYRCQHGDAALKRKQVQGIKDYGFWIEGVLDDCDAPYHANFHTHNVQESFGHPDLQICFPISLELAGDFLHSAVKLIKEGIQFENGKEYEGIMKGYKILILDAKENGRPVKRLILPDKYGSYNSKDFFLQQTMLD